MPELENVRQVDEIDRDLTPQAIINMASEKVVSRGGQLVKGKDELDCYRGASFEMNGQVFAIRRYKGHPRGTSTIYLDPRIGDVNEITTRISNILTTFDIPESALHWQRKDNPEL